MKVKKDKRSALDKEIDRILEKMSTVKDQTSSEYANLEESLQKLMDAKVSHKEATTDEKKWMELVKPVIVGAFGLIQIGLIMNHEEMRVISTKALGFILKGRA